MRRFSKSRNKYSITPTNYWKTPAKTKFDVARSTIPSRKTRNVSRTWSYNIVTVWSRNKGFKRKKYTTWREQVIQFQQKNIQDLIIEQQNQAFAIQSAKNIETVQDQINAQKNNEANSKGIL